MDDFNNNTPSGNEQQNTPESTGNFQSAPEAGNDAQRANSGNPYNGGYQPNNGYPYSNGGGNTNNGSSNANGSNNGYSSGNNGYYGSNGAYRPSSTYSGNNSYVYYGNSGQPPKNRLTISRQSIKRRRYSSHNRCCGLCGTRCYGHCGFSQQ